MQDNKNTAITDTDAATPQKKKPDVPARIGAVIAGIVFLFVGALPSLLFGGYAGLILGKALFGGDAASLAVRIVAGGGMVLGVLAVLSLFLVVGGVLGSFIGHVVRDRDTEVAAQPDEATSK